MTTTTFEKAAEKIGDSTQKIAGAFKDRFDSARRFVKETEELADDLYDTTTRQIQRHPAESVAMTFVAGVAAGMLMSWLIRRK